MDALLAIVAGLAIVGLACAIWGVLIERQLFVIRRASVRVLPAGTEPIRVLHVSDIHMAPWQRRKQRWLLRALASEPYDLVVDTGDNLGHANGIAPVLSSLAPALTKPGVFVHGSNDYHAPVLRNPLAYLRKPSERGDGPDLDTARLTAAFESAGWLNLNNRGGELLVNGSRLAFVGVDDAHDDLADIGSIGRSVADQTTGAALRIGVTHAPYLAVVAAMADAGAAVTFAGHTHGGQVAIPGVGALVTNCDLPPRYAKGLSAWVGKTGASTILNVCAGLGHSIFAPVRFAVRPELRVLTLLPIEG